MLTVILVLMIVSMAYLWLRTHLLLGACRCELELSRIREEALDAAGREVDREFREYRRKQVEKMVRGLEVQLPCEDVTKEESIEAGLAAAQDGKWIEVGEDVLLRHESLRQLFHWSEEYLYRFVDEGESPSPEERKIIADVWKDAGKDLPPFLQRLLETGD